MNRRNDRLVHTFIKLLVIVALIAALFALMLPALERAREASRRTLCREHLKRIGLAMHHYHNAHGFFPPGIISDHEGNYTANENVGRAGAAGASALTLILPFMDAKATWQNYNTSLGCAALANSTAVGEVIPAYLCPANALAFGRIANRYYPSQPGRTDYVLSIGGSALLISGGCGPYVITGSGPSGYPLLLKPGAGAFNVNRSAMLRYIRDGAANTFIVGEGSSGMPHGRYNGSDFGGETPNERHVGFAVEQAWSQGYLGGKNGLGGYGSVFAATAYDAWYDRDCKMVSPDGAKGFTALPMNRNRDALRGTSYAKSFPDGLPSLQGKLRLEDEWNDRYPLPPEAISVSPFRSYHKGFCHFLFADGSVHALNEDIDPKLYVGLGSIAGREPVKTPPEPR